MTRIAGVLVYWAVSAVAPALAQDTTVSNLNRERMVGVVAAGGLAITGSLIALDRAWFEQYEQVPFQTFNDGDEWYQMDKAGHVWSAYTLG
ncbi:MAG: hypothetical protein KDC02_22115, partial [Flavobacteriales bacterium]|nr:hypothetical protein [Flavobacteriales bacterium]